jgi:hypothetical protein
MAAYPVRNSPIALYHGRDCQTSSAQLLERIALGVNNVERTASALRGIIVNRLTYRCRICHVARTGREAAFDETLKKVFPPKE